MNHAIPNTTLTLGLLASSAFGIAFAADAFPQADRLEPRTAKVGSVLTVSGKGLGKEAVDEVFLTDHRFDMKVKVLEQSDSTLKIRIPPFAKPGRLQLLFLTAGEKAVYLEQPLYVQIDELEVPETPVEVTKAPPKPAQPVRTIEIASVGNHIPVPAEGPTASHFASSGVTPTPTTKPVPREEARVQPRQQPVVPAAAPAIAPASVPASPAVSADAAIVPARLLKRTPLAMPAGAPGFSTEAQVELSIRVRTDGRVGTVRVVKGNPVLAAAAIRCVREWEYESARRGATPMESDVTVVFNFKR
jgi:TonB family protein